MQQHAIAKMKYVNFLLHFCWLFHIMSTFLCNFLWVLLSFTWH